LREQLLHKVRFAHRNNSLLSQSHSTFGALIGSRAHAVRRRRNLQLLHVFVTQLLSHVHHLITSRGAPLVWVLTRPWVPTAVVLGSGTSVCRSTYGISLYVHHAAGSSVVLSCWPLDIVNRQEQRHDTTMHRIHKDSFVFAFPQFMLQNPLT